MSDSYNNILVKPALSPVLRTNGAVNGIAIDRAEDGSMFNGVLFAVQTGTITDGTHTVEVQDSDVVGSGYVAVADPFLQGTEPAIVAADDDKVFEIGYNGAKRFVRIVVTASGTTTGGIVGAVAVLSDPGVRPVIRN